MPLARLVIPLIVVLIVGSFCIFTVDEREKAILFRLGEIERSDYESGLHFKLPFVNNVRKFDSRVLNLDSEPERFLTFEKKDVIVDSYVKWRITDVEQFYRSTGGDQRRANLLLAQKIQDQLRSEFGKRTVEAAVSGERSLIMDIVTAEANKYARDLGMAVLDVRIRRIDLPEEVSNSVYQRMRAERERVARDFRSRGAEAAERIEADADRERTVILAEAYRDAETLRGEGDAQAAGIYASAYQRDDDFYSFYRSLNAYQRSFQDRSDVLVLEPDAAFFRFFKSPDGR